MIIFIYAIFDYINLCLIILLFLFQKSLHLWLNACIFEIFKWQISGQ